MKASEFVQIANDIVNKYNTLYVLGCFGGPLNDTNKKRYINAYSYNKNRSSIINKATNNTFGFDCVCLIKGILWGWLGDKNKTYGGAVYKSNNVPDVGADEILKYCTNVSSNFNNIEEGEIVHLKGHVGIYIGNGLAVECTPKWKNKVQITSIGNIGTKSGYNARTWENHGKLKFIEYDKKQTKNEYTGIYPLLPKRGYFLKGDKGEQVKYIQQFLNWSIGASLIIDGSYGILTYNAVKKFQQLTCAKVDGSVGKETLGKMKSFVK